MAAAGVRKRANERELVRELRLQGEQLRELHPRNLAGDGAEWATVLAADLGLGIVGVQMRAAAPQPDENHRGALLFGERRIFRTEPEEAGPAEAAERREAEPHETAPIQRAGAGAEGG